jgi:membrane protease YdiL (CAAX protease family)
MFFFNELINVYFPVFIVIFFLFIIIDSVKILFKNKLSKYWGVDYKNLNLIENKKKDDFFVELNIELMNFRYKYQEYKLIFFSCSIFMIIVFSIIKFYFQNFFIYLITQKYSILYLIYRIFITIFINMTIYLGTISQLIYGNETISKKPIFMFFIEQIYAPILEESIFRGIIMNIFRYNGYSNLSSGFLNSILFGLAHFRHLFDKYLIKKSLNQIIFQSLYTSFFGFYSSYVYCYSNTIISSFILHGTCNLLGFPRFDYRDDDDVSNNIKKLFNSLYIIGIIGFIIEIFYFQ